MLCFMQVLNVKILHVLCEVLAHVDISTYIWPFWSKVSFITSIDFASLILLYVIEINSKLF